MDKKRREKLRKAMGMLTEALNITQDVCDQEQGCVDNYPENLQNTDTFEKMEDAVDNLNNAIDEIVDAKNYIQYAIQS